jgi:hypothetical protein
MHTTLNMFCHLKIKTTVRFMGRLPQEHVGFFGSTAPFFHIASYASRDNVFPGIFAPSRSGHHMIQRQVISGVATVLAGMTIPV